MMLPFNRLPKQLSSQSPLTFVRYKRYKKWEELPPVSPATQKIVNQLSILSASKKQPKLLTLCNEDLVKHRTIMNAWKLVQQKKQQHREQQLQLQYQSIHDAMEDLKMVSPELYSAAGGDGKVDTGASKKFARFPIEMRVPTDFPPTKPWIYEYSPKSES
ncbi:mitochondrial 54S ribosomal protein mL40 [Lodderomyces beijingensis]|uniref:Large ribosomal subunit protein mL40 n=1 Tax=Lodderomyces beijingensis TaxID=1775926 RepID=A0ABP0ZDH0_9ASCO